MITVSSLKHSAKSEDSYAYDNETLHVRLRTLRGEVDKVILCDLPPRLDTTLS
ncbi:Neopullulanase [Escherichia coli]|nr:Neopullulanase [Escherichia coli]